MVHERQDERGHGAYARRQVEAMEQLAREAGAIQDTLELIAHHLVGGMSREEVAAATAEARALKQTLRPARIKLSAAMDAAQPTPKDPPQ